VLKKHFWKKDLKDFSKKEWEALCDRCGKCCLIKLEDEDTLYFTNVSCKLLCTKTAKCLDYKNRKKKVKECVILTYQNLDALNWMPDTCAYKLIYQNKDLPKWHYLKTGNFKKMTKEKMCVSNQVISEKFVKEKDLHNYITHWK
jgi:hypothetical protein